tara:strand:- start:3412 stop:3642 length:231 start_codon:yes stop_codon:yes gene_type:complete
MLFCNDSNDECQGLITKLSTVVQNVLSLNANSKEEELKEYIKKNRTSILFLIHLNVSTVEKTKFINITNKYLENDS